MRVRSAISGRIAAILMSTALSAGGAGAAAVLGQVSHPALTAWAATTQAQNQGDSGSGDQQGGSGTSAPGKGTGKGTAGSPSGHGGGAPSGGKPNPQPAVAPPPVSHAGAAIAPAAPNPSKAAISGVQSDPAAANAPAPAAHEAVRAESVAGAVTEIPGQLIDPGTSSPPHAAGLGILEPVAVLGWALLTGLGVVLVRRWKRRSVGRDFVPVTLGTYAFRK